MLDFHVYTFTINLVNQINKAARASGQSHKSSNRISLIKYTYPIDESREVPALLDHGTPCSLQKAR